MKKKKSTHQITNTQKYMIYNIYDIQYGKRKKTIITTQLYMIYNTNTYIFCFIFYSDTYFRLVDVVDSKIFEIDF